jgi:outer membrane cobalamin receptor
VANAQVFVTSRSEIVARTETDERGAFAVGELPPGTYELHVVREGFRSVPREVELTAGAAPEVTLQLQVSAFSEAVVVSAAEVDLPLSRTPATTSVITRSELETYQRNTIAEALRSVPGLSIARTGVEGAVTSLFSRGGESDFTAVAIDGVPVNSFGGSFDFGHLAAGDVQRVEVVRGPQSALWSGGAIGGVINIITQPDARLSLDGSSELGSRGNDRLTAAGVVPAGPWRFAFGGDRQTSDGLNGRTFAPGRVANDDWRSEHLSAGVGRDAATHLSLTTRFERSERGYPGAYGSDPAGTYGGIDDISRGRNHTALVGASVSHAFSRVRPSAQLTWLDFDSDFVDPYGPSESGSRRLTARGQADVRVASALNATVGAEWLQERATSTYITGTAGTGIPVERSVASVFGEARYDAGPAFVTAGLRVEEIRRDPLDADPFAFSPRPALPQDSVTAVTPRLSASWFLRRADDGGSWTRLRGSAGLGIRPPDAFELAFTDNPGLKPERTRSAEVSIEQAIADGRLLADATVFFNRYDDLIVTVGRAFSNASRYQSDNISNARARGIETLLSARLPRGLSATAGYTFLDAEVLAIDRLGIAPPPFKPGDPLIRRPRHQGWLESSWRGRSADLFVTLGTRGRTLDIDPTFGAFGGLFPARGYVVVGAGGAWRAGKVVQVFGRVTNLLDRRYEEVLGFPAPPRSLYAGIRVAVR